MDEFNLNDYRTVVKRRKWTFLLPAFAVFVLVALVAYLLPPVYRSEALVQIEEPEIPREVIDASSTVFADQRIQQIQQKMTTMQNLVDIVTKLSLYETKRRKVPMTTVIEDMRESIHLELVSAEFSNPQMANVAAREMMGAMAFTLSFEHENPATAQRVASELLTRFLEEDAKVRHEKTKETTEFLKAEAARLEAEIAEHEQRIAAFKAENAGSLPEDMPFNMQMTERANRDVMEIGRRIAVLNERRGSLRGQLAHLDPYARVLADGQLLVAPSTQLNALRAKFTTLSSRYGPDHPDVAKMRREIAALEAEVGGDPAGGLQAQIEDVERQLAAAQGKYSETHPDVKNLHRQLAALKDERAALPPSTGQKQPELPDNPAYLQVQAQLEAVENEYQSLLNQRKEAIRQQNAYELRLRQTPTVERGFSALKRNYENLVLRYRELTERRMAAETAEAVQMERKAERLAIIEPPDLPETPAKPPRKLILGLGFVLAIGCGIGCVTLAEAFSGAVQGSRQIEALTGQMPLVTVPYIQSNVERNRRRLGLGFAVIAFVGLVAAGAWAVDTYVLSLDVLWQVALRKLGLSDLATSLANIWPLGTDGRGG